MWRCIEMTADSDPCEDDPTPDHMVYKGVVYDVDDVTRVDEGSDGAELWEVWATVRGDGDGESQQGEGDSVRNAVD
jgi:hypothetical protein